MKWFLTYSYFREKPVKDHLRNVYGAMSLALLSCALGSYIHMTTAAIGVITIKINVMVFIYLKQYVFLFLREVY